MELRLLITERERQIFAQRVNQAREKHDAGVRETPKSRLGTAHIAFGNLYGLFEHDDEPPERMISGLATHDLETLPQSYPKPDLTHLPPWSVVESGELWSLTKGGGLLVRRGALIVWKLSGVRAVLIYAMKRPWDTSESFAQSRFERVGEPIEFPYARALDGSQVWLQPMVLWEEQLRTLFDERVGSTRFEVLGDPTRIRFDNPLPFQPSLDRPAFSLDEPAGQPGVAPSNENGTRSAQSVQR